VAAGDFHWMVTTQQRTRPRPGKGTAATRRGRSFDIPGQLLRRRAISRAMGCLPWGAEARYLPTISVSHCSQSPQALYKKARRNRLCCHLIPQLASMEMATERDPFLSATNPSLRAYDHSRSSVGPLEIPRSTRYTILAGLWSATFLSVCVSQHTSRHL